MKKDIYIVSAVRTPIGSFMGALASVPATKLGAIAIKAALERAGVNPQEVDLVYMGNVLTANEGQSPARQAALFAGLEVKTICTTINKVCASGMKAVMLAAQAIQLGDADIAVAGGMESMSNVPYYLSKAREGYKLGNGELIDGVIKDGLWDVYNDYHMGNAAEKCALDYNITREQQDEFAMESYRRSTQATEEGSFKNEIVPVEITGRKGTTIVDTDEDYKKVDFAKIPTLKPVFQKEGGTVTAANASNLNDGAAALVLMSKEKAEQLGIKPLARILSYADNEQEPENFTTAPTGAIKKALHKAGISKEKVDFYEINEAFAVVSLANNQLLGLDPAKVDVYGGAVSLGHPIGCSGARILVTLISVLNNKSGKTGVAGICNGGGGASAIVLEKANG